ncbi:DUF5908 family protein [Aequorivita sp. F47161]|uniref:DUF5908 family protein n=1 Tax=Aequorivita vitellina TaxID=2874475 RepID=A0A9X1QVX5_9FLAO|nr:DUF5908 family protein [Aequorivita vitellina]MCG2418347.1 DUF5908 family protein [Aequorivita vitellina]
MPIEIKELHIKINVNGTEQSNVSFAEQKGKKAETILKSCVEEVMRIESRKKER